MLLFSIVSTIGNTTSNDGPSTFELIGRFFSTIFIFLFVLILAYYATKFIAGSRLQRASSNNIKILESVSVGYQSVIQLLQIGDDKYIVIAVTKDKVTFLANVDKDSINLENRNIDISKLPFEKYLKSFMKKDIDGQEDDKN